MAGAKSVDAKDAKEREGRQGGQKEKSGIGQKRKRRAVDALCGRSVTRFEGYGQMCGPALLNLPRLPSQVS